MRAACGVRRRRQEAFEQLDARFAVRCGGGMHRTRDVAYHPQPNGKTVFIRVEACGGHACLPKLRASAAGGFGPPTSVTSSHAACSTASCGPPSQSRCSDKRSTVQSAAERRDLHEPFGELQPSARGRLRAAAHTCGLPSLSPKATTGAIRRCRPPLGTADGTRRSNGVPRQDGITRSIDCLFFVRLKT